MAEVSVIIPVYNVEKYLKKCVESVLTQTYKDIEIILVDDGSTDKSGDICDELAKTDGRIRVIHQKNKGLGGARNTGIDNCNTEYLLFLDSDDYIHPQLIERCLCTAKESNCDMVLFDSVSVDENGRLGVKNGAQVTENIILPEKELRIISKNPTAWDKLYKTSLFKDNGIYFPDRVWYEDLRTIIKLILFAERVVKLKSEPLYYYLQRSDSIMHTPDYGRIVKERTEAVDELFAFYKQCGKFEEYSDMLAFIALYHAFLLPCLEMHRTQGNYKNYMLILLEKLKGTVNNPLENPYLSLLRRNERIILSLALKKRFFAIRIITSLNCTVKKLKHN